MNRTLGCDPLWILKMEACLGLIVLYIQHEYLRMWKTTYLFPVFVSFPFGIRLFTKLIKFVWETPPREFRLVLCMALRLVIGNLIQNIGAEFLAPCYP